MKHCCFEKVNYLFQFFYGGHLVLIIERYWQISDQEEKIYSADLKETHHFLIWSWLFPLGYIEDKLSVNCGDISSDFRSIHVMRMYFKLSEYEEDCFEVKADTFMSMEVIILNYYLRSHWYSFQILVMVRFFGFKAVVDTKRIIIFVKGCDRWWIRGRGGDNLQMILFYLINSLFKYCIWFDYFCLKYVVHTKLIIFFFDIFWLLIMLLFEINPLFFCMFKTLIKFIKIGL